jgi:TnpA family transposase
MLALRNPQRWGDGHAWAAEGQRFASGRQPGMTAGRSRYQGYGLGVYWQVETQAVCLYAQLRHFSCSAVAALLAGRRRHDTERRVEKHLVDSHGQSEGACACGHRLGGVCLRPRLKRIKDERLSLPTTGLAGALPNRAGGLSRPLRWDRMAQPEAAMGQPAGAWQTGTATAEAIWRRGNSYHVPPPTSKALAALGQVEKTIDRCA